MRTFASALSASAVVTFSSWLAAQPAPPPPVDPVEPPPAEPDAPPPDAPPPDAPPPDAPPPDAPPPDAPPAEAPPPALPPGHPPTDLPPGHPAPRPAGLPPLPLAPPAIFPSQLQDEEAEEELVGIHGGRVFIRTPHDTFRFYPQMRLRTDFNWAPGAPDLPRAQEGQNLHPSLAVRRLRLEMSGEILERLAFTGGVELGGGRIGDTVYRGDGTSRFAKANGHDGRVRPGEVDVSYRFRKWLSITAGLFNAPFSMENRTREYATTFMERSLAIRGLVVPYDMDYGVSLWGEILDDRALNYEAAVMLGDGIDRPGEDARADYMARVFARPLTTLGDALFFQQAQIGLSLRHGERDQSFVAYDYPSIATNQGFVLWQPGYVDSLGRVTHVIPSGAQNAIGGELRLPIRMPTGAVFDIRGEAYFVSNNTREAVDGFVTTNTERLGRLKGVGWYGEISWWACFTDQLANGEPGIYRPYTVDLDHEAPILKAFQVSALVSGINANYDGATRGGSLADPNTPTSNIAIYQVGGAVQYWFNYNFRAALNYFAYITPGSGDVTVNQAVVPDNVKDAGDGHVHHELGARTAITF